MGKNVLSVLCSFLCCRHDSYKSIRTDGKVLVSNGAQIGEWRKGEARPKIVETIAKRRIKTIWPKNTNYLRLQAQLKAEKQAERHRKMVLQLIQCNIENKMNLN